MLSPSPNFFHTKRSLSEIKAELLPAYFKIWAETTTAEELVLTDLNAGNGFEANGEIAAALKILEAFAQAENATENEAKTLKLFLSDVSKTNLEKLKQSLQDPAEEELKLPENIFLLNEPEAEETLSELLQKVTGLIAADPFSYVQAQEMVSEAIQQSQTDMFLLFDYKKLEKTFLAPSLSVIITQLFGEILPELKGQFLLEKSAKKREQFLMEQLEIALQTHHFFPVVFKINALGKVGNSAYLILTGNSKETYFQAKEFLQTYSEFQEDGVPLFGANLNYQPAAIPGFSSFLNKYSLENLAQELAGKKADFHYLTIREIYETHSLGTHYILENYVSAFRSLRKAETVNLVDAANKKVTKVTAESVVFYRLHSKV